MRYFQITTGPKMLPPETTWNIMTYQPSKIEKMVGNTFGLRTWVEYGFKHPKDDHDWAEYRVTDYATRRRWWALVMRAYTLVSLRSAAFAALGHVAPPTPAASDAPVQAPIKPLDTHPTWDLGTG